MHKTIQNHCGKWWATLGLLLICCSAQAHTDSASASGFVSGFLHPLFGLDHVVAMVAVGLWGAFLGQPAIWLLPVVFPLVMAVGGALGVMGIHIPAVELGIAGSAVVLGAVVLLKVKAPLLVAAVLVGVFAVFHGHAHGTELPDATSPLSYSLGFVISTGLLHIAGILFGLLTKWPKGVIAVQACGGVIALFGAYFLVA